MRYIIIILLFISFNTSAQNRCETRAWNLTCVDTSGNPNTSLQWVSVDSIKAMLGMWQTSNTSTATRSLDANFRISNTNECLVRYTISIGCTLSLSGGQTGSVFLEYSANGSSGWTEAGRLTNTNAGALTIGLNIVNTQTAQLTGVIPAGYYVRLRTSGAATITYISGQETIL